MSGPRLSCLSEPPRAALCLREKIETISCELDSGWVLPSFPSRRRQRILAPRLSNALYWMREHRVETRTLSWCGAGACPHHSFEPHRAAHCFSPCAQAIAEYSIPQNLAEFDLRLGKRLLTLCVSRRNDPSILGSWGKCIVVSLGGTGPLQ